MRDSTTFLIYRFGGRDVLAIPDEDAALRAAGVSVLPAVTPRARAFRAALRALVAAGADRAIAERRELPIASASGFPWSSFVGELERCLGTDDLVPVFLQARQSVRGRAYVHLLSREGERIAFAKLATNAGGALSLQREAGVLRALMSRGAESFRFPSLLADGQFAGRQYLLLAPIPSRSRPHPSVWTEPLGRIRSEIAGTQRTLPSVRVASWWGDFARAAHAAPALAEELEQDLDVFTCAGAHGDLVNWNICVEREDHWVFDWENHAEDAPLLADPVRFQLGLYTRDLEASPARTAAKLLARLGSSDRERRPELARALAFLHARDATSATVVAQQWGAR